MFIVYQTPDRKVIDFLATRDLSRGPLRPPIFGLLNLASLFESLAAAFEEASAPQQLSFPFMKEEYDVTP